MMLEAGIPGFEFEVRGRIQLNLPRTAKGIELGALVRAGHPGWQFTDHRYTKRSPRT